MRTGMWLDGNGMKTPHSRPQVAHNYSHYHRIPMGMGVVWAANGNGNGNGRSSDGNGNSIFYRWKIKFPPAVWTACCFCTVTCSDSLINVEQWTVIGSDSYNDDDWWVVSLINNASVRVEAYGAKGLVHVTRSCFLQCLIVIQCTCVDTKERRVLS